MTQHTTTISTARKVAPIPVNSRSPAIEGCSHLVMIVPHEEGLRQAEAMETWFQACSTASPFTLELVGTKKEQGFVLRASSKEQLVLLSKQLEAQYPQAQLRHLAPTADPLILRPGEHAVIGELALTAPSWMPLKTFSGEALALAGTDPLAGILAAMEAVNSRERIVSQLALVRAPESWIAGDIRKAVEHPLQEERDQAAAHLHGHATSPNGEGLKLLGGLLAFLTALYGYHWYREQTWLPFIALGTIATFAVIRTCWWWFRQQNNHIYDTKLVAEKLMRAAFYTHLRIIVIGSEVTSTEKRLRTLLSHLETAYRQFTLASANGLFLKQVRHLSPYSKEAQRLPSATSAFPYHHPLLRLLHGAPCKDVWNGLELSGAFHLPQETTDLPLVRRISVKHLLFSPEISRAIATTPATLPPVLIGHSKHRGHVTQVLLPFGTLFSHKFLIGRSRSGKSVLMQHMIRGAMQRVTDGSPQPGLFAIDPHHDLIEDVLGIVPLERLSEVMLLDFTDTDYPIGLNPLDATMAFTRDQAVSNLMSCFERVWSEFWGPRMAYFLKSVCLLLYTLNADLVRQGRASKQYTILDINPLLQYQDYAMQVLQGLDMSEIWHQELLAWWQHTYFTLPKQSSFRQEVIMPILTKLGMFNDNQVLRRIVGQPITTAPIHECITKGSIVLCALSSRDLDDASVNILGSTLMNLLHRAFATQQQIPLSERRKVFVAVDELQNFSGSMFDKLLSEDAKFGCAMLLSTQNLKRLNQIKEGLLEMVLSNCENLCTFNVSATDAKLLEEELQEKVSQKHIISQPVLHCYTRIAIAGHPLQFASVHIAQPASWKKDATQLSRIDQVRQRNRARLLTAKTVDAMHTDHLKRFLDVRHFADKIQRETRAAQRSRQQQEDAMRRAEHVRTHSLPLSSPMKQAVQDQSAPAVSAQHLSSASPIASTTSQSDAKTQASPSTNQQTSPVSPPGQIGTPVTAALTDTTNFAAPTSLDEEKGSVGKRKRSHPRSSRRQSKLRSVVKSPVGTPPPGLVPISERRESEECNPISPPVLLSNGIAWEREGRERERQG